jgi:hypothetical protein
VNRRRIAIAAAAALIAVLVAGGFLISRASTSVEGVAHVSDSAPAKLASTSICEDPTQKAPCYATGHRWVTGDGEVHDNPDTQTPAPAPAAVPSDFTIGIQVLETHCFGSAGCNVTYRIDPKTTTGCPSTCTVIYQVAGAVDVQIGSFTMTGSIASIQESEFVQTKSSKAKLTATVSSVLPN